MQLEVYNDKKETVGKVSLPEKVFELKIDIDLVKQAVDAQTANARLVLAHTKDRSEVSGGGRKPWRQKGTGRARHGSIDLLFGLEVESLLVRLKIEIFQRRLIKR